MKGNILPLPTLFIESAAPIAPARDGIVPNLSTSVVAPDTRSVSNEIPVLIVPVSKTVSQNC